MKNFAYIPTKDDKQQLKLLIFDNQTENQPNNQKISPPNSSQGEYLKNSSPKISGRDLDKLLQRLTKVTKRQYDIQQQTTHIVNVNQELQKKRLQGQKVQNRLLARGKQREKKLQQLSNKLQKQKKELFFRQIPQICQKSQRLKHKTIDRRLQDLIRQRVCRKQELTQKYQPSFRPVVDPQSQFINDIENLGDLYNRMRLKQKDAQKRKQSITQRLKQEEAEILTFKPVINQKSRDIVQALPPRNITETPYRIAIPTQEESEIFPFVPTINKNTERILQKSKKDKDCFKRLYQHAKQLTLKRQTKNDERDKVHSFHPSLNTKSLKMAESSRNNQQLKDYTTENADQFIEQIKIGDKQENTRARTFSLRHSTENKQKWDWDIQSEFNRQRKPVSSFKVVYMR